MLHYTTLHYILHYRPIEAKRSADVWAARPATETRSLPDIFAEVEPNIRRT